MAERKPRLLGALSPRRFLREYWQCKPLLVRGALPGFGGALSPEELAGLALEDEIESRLVLGKGRASWELRRGPFTERDFTSLPESRWTLLVQAVDQWVPAACALRARFDFLPGWRFDDVMVSYAADKGGVGPHFDYYDVFLVQGSGRRRWKIGQRCDADSALRRGAELRILREFHTTAEYVLEPGDLLYIPPGLAHWGVAEGPCMTWSVGFRAPARADLLREAADAAAAQVPEDQRFGDAGISYPRDGRIPDAAIRQLQRVLRGVADDRALLADWFARYMTERKYPEIDIRPTRHRPLDLRGFLAQGGVLERHPASRFAWITGTGGARLYVDGEAMACAPRLAGLLCGNAALDGVQLASVARSQKDIAVLNALLARGALVRRA